MDQIIMPFKNGVPVKNIIKKLVDRPFYDNDSPFLYETINPEIEYEYKNIDKSIYLLTFDRKTQWNL